MGKGRRRYRKRQKMMYEKGGRRRETRVVGGWRGRKEGRKEVRKERRRYNRRLTNV